MAEEAVFELTAESASELVQMDDVGPEVTIVLPSGLEPSVLECVARPKQAVVASLGLELEPLAPEPVVRPIQTDTAPLKMALMKVSLEFDSSALEPNTRMIPTSFELPTPMPCHTEQTVPVSHFMDLDDSRGSFNSTIIKEKMVEVDQAITVKEPS